ncbi:hypothetical protein [Rhizosphaericola mali]|uniref:Lipoprotein n=1 Tax=Rhizosphaericola mali TaxID=2545455 RepID=A0A5P2G138_9BACT|nr:hypothetical protein [Rhizosphaericola mali]QES87819.1 hypothetical protein E0W69_003770 [Rhizosphaericola mali]
MHRKNKLSFLIPIVAIFLLAACHGKKSGKSDSVKYKAESFFDEFSSLKIPYFATDTSLTQHTDSFTITKEVISKYIPDTLLEKLTAKSGNELHPVGKVDIKDYRYLLLAVTNHGSNIWYILAFDKNNKYLAYMTGIQNKTDNGYRYKLTINSEPTFTVGRSKKDNKGHELYTNTGFGFSAAAKRFTLVINDTNENLPDEDEVFNPIDTLPQKFPFSGNYIKDKHNQLFLRDGKRPSEYNFFLHFDKTDEDPNSKGELKGTIKMVSENAAIYQQGGDPCVINFDMTSNTVKIKEQGNCANHRGSITQFNDTFKKKVSKSESKKK